MFLALATLAEPTTIYPGLPTLCGVYADRAEADAYCAWENARADWSVYYVADAADRTQCAVAGDDLAFITLHRTDGEYHWSAQYPGGSILAYGADFHATPGEAWADAEVIISEVTSEAFRAAMARHV